jgi:hypothetical protein
MAAKRLIVITNDLPYPPNYGHKVDQFNRWSGFRQSGWELMLICWRSPRDPPTTAADAATLSDVFSTVEILPIKHGIGHFLRRLSMLPRYPSHVASRIPDDLTRRRLIDKARAFDPSVVVFDGIYGAKLGQDIARACGVPTVLRGHNVEFRYFAQQVRASTNFRDKIAWSIAQIGLERWERTLTRQADWCLQISWDDVAFWRSEGIKNLSWAPTFYPGAAAHGTLRPPHERAFDVAYIGNMRLPNNLQGLAWFVREVLPHLRRSHPTIRLCFAGANPTEEARRLFSEAPEITLVPNAPSADEILSNGRVLINPILSGSGINVKSIDMLRYDAPIVTTPVGVQGFAPDLRRQFVVCDDAATFAEAIAVALANPAPPKDREMSRAIFGDRGLAEQIEIVSNVADRI